MQLSGCNAKQFLKNFLIGSVSMLLSRRPLDTSVLGFRNWNLTSVHFWGENPRGQWRMLIRDKVTK